MATASWQPAVARAEGNADPEDALLSLTHCVLAGRDLVLLVGAAGSGKSAVLAELERRLAPSVLPLRVSASPQPGAELPAQILEQLQLPASGCPQELLRQHIERMHKEGSALALLVDEGDRLPADVVRWLLSLASDGAIRTPVVLATRRFERCLAALAESGSCVSLVRLGGPAFAPLTGGDELELIDYEEVVTAASAPEPAVPIGAAPPASLQAPEPAGRWREPLRSAEELLAELDPSQLSAADAEPAIAAPIRVRALRPTPARVAWGLDGPHPASRSHSLPQSIPVQRSSPWLGVAAAGAVVVALGLASWLLSSSGGLPIDARNAGDRSPGVTRAAEKSPTGERDPGLALSSGHASHGGDAGTGVADVGIVVSDVRHAISLLAESDEAGMHAAARQFLRDRGPDPVGYELLDELDGRRAASPSDAVPLLTARARVRTALCAAWADDPLGEAAGRLGCPGAGP